MATPSVKQLRQHRQRLSECTTFEAFKTVQIAFVDLLIEIIDREDEELREHARILLQGDPDPDSETSESEIDHILGRS